MTCKITIPYWVCQNITIYGTLFMFFLALPLHPVLCPVVVTQLQSTESMASNFASLVASLVSELPKTKMLDANMDYPLVI